VIWSGRTLIPLFLVAGALFLIIQVKGIMLPFVLAATVAYLLCPLVRFFEVRGFRRAPIVVLVYGGLLTTFVLAGYLVAPRVAAEAESAAQEMPMYVQRGTEAFDTLRQRSAAISREDSPWMQLAGRTVLNPAALDWIAKHGSTWPDQILIRMPSFATGIIPLLSVVVLVPFIAFFFMLEGPKLRDYVLKLVPGRHVEMSLNILVEVDNSLGKYIRGILLEACCVGFLAFVGFWIIDLNYAMQVAIIVGLANIMPYVGPIVGGLVGTGIAIFEWGTLTGVLLVWLVCASVRFIEDWLIQPLVLRHAVHLHPVLIIFALMAGAELFGFWGLLFAVPVACAVQVLVKVIWQWYVSEYRWHAETIPSEALRIPLI